MSRLRPKKLHVRFVAPATRKGPIVPRCYTLTHSDATGDLYLTVGPEVDRKQISGWYTRFMRDEVLAEWDATDGGPVLRVICHVSGGLVLGSAGWRYSIFQQEMPLVLQAFRYGDRGLFEAQPELDDAFVLVHFRSSRRRYRRVERWGTLSEYRL
jgi:hypothetical protein